MLTNDGGFRLCGVHAARQIPHSALVVAPALEEASSEVAGVGPQIGGHCVQRFIQRFHIDQCLVASGQQGSILRGQESSRPVHHHAVECCLHLGELRGDVLPQAVVVSQFLGLDAADDLLRPFDSWSS